jgi:signal transduction histidine kinase
VSARSRGSGGIKPRPPVGWAGLPAFGWFLAGLAGSALVASLVGIPPGEAGTLLAVITLAALAVVAAGLGLQRRLRRRRARVARQGALTAAVTAAVALAGLWAVSAQMLVSSHDLAVVLASLPVAAGAGVAYGVATSRQVAADLEALAGTARQLEAGDLAARAPVQGTAEVALIAETLNAAAARLAEARERERRMEQERRDLIAWASHDLRTPLASLRALAEALADDLAPDEATRRRYLAGLTANVERLSTLVDDLFDLAAIQAGAVTLQLEPTSLPELAAEVVDRFEPEATAAGVRLECRLDGDRPVLAGRDQLGRVLANLVANGIRHTPRGGRLRVAVADSDDSAVLRVTDACGGIPEADLSRVFDQLWRGDPARSTKGAGLGLAIARGLVDAHGGTIGVANVPGGCEFTVRLPSSTGTSTVNGHRSLSDR